MVGTVMEIPARMSAIASIPQNEYVSERGERNIFAYVGMYAIPSADTAKTIAPNGFDVTPHNTRASPARIRQILSTFRNSLYP